MPAAASSGSSVPESDPSLPLITRPPSIPHPDDSTSIRRESASASKRRSRSTNEILVPGATTMEELQSQLSEVNNWSIPLLKTTRFALHPSSTCLTDASITVTHTTSTSTPTSSHPIIPPWTSEKWKFRYVRMKQVYEEWAEKGILPDSCAQSDPWYEPEPVALGSAVIVLQPLAHLLSIDDDTGFRLQSRIGCQGTLYFEISVHDHTHAAEQAQHIILKDAVNAEREARRMERHRVNEEANEMINVMRAQAQVVATNYPQDEHVQALMAAVTTGVSNLSRHPSTSNIIPTTHDDDEDETHFLEDHMQLIGRHITLNIKCNRVDWNVVGAVSTCEHVIMMYTFDKEETIQTQPLPISPSISFGHTHTITYPHVTHDTLTYLVDGTLHIDLWGIPNEMTQKQQQMTYFKQQQQQHIQTRIEIQRNTASRKEMRPMTGQKAVSEVVDSASHDIPSSDVDVDVDKNDETTPSEPIVSFHPTTKATEDDEDDDGDEDEDEDEDGTSTGDDDEDEDVNDSELTSGTLSPNPLPTTTTSSRSNTRMAQRNVVCEHCENVPPTCMCVECVLKLCDSCFGDLHRSGKKQTHQKQSWSAVRKKKAEHCTDCETALATVGCDECARDMCMECDTIWHSRGSKQQHIRYQIIPASRPATRQNVIINTTALNSRPTTSQRDSSQASTSSTSDQTCSITPISIPSTVTITAPSTSSPKIIMSSSTLSSPDVKIVTPPTSTRPSVTIKVGGTSTIATAKAVGGAVLSPTNRAITITSSTAAPKTASPTDTPTTATSRAIVIKR